MSDTTIALLSVKDLSFDSTHGKSTAHRGPDRISSSIELVSESSSGRSALSRSTPSLLPPHSITSDSHPWRGRVLHLLSKEPLLSTTPQKPQTSLTPIFQMGRQAELLEDQPQSLKSANFFTATTGDPQKPACPARHQIIASESFSVSLPQLWKIAGHPSKVSKAVPMLRWFQAPAKLQKGSSVAEMHNIMGWPQAYAGTITDFRVDSIWSMSSKPLGWSPFPLPHDVEYAFSGDERESSLEITCTFQAGGLLAFPFVVRIVKWFMLRATEDLLKYIAVQTARFSGDSLVLAPETIVPLSSR